MTALLSETRVGAQRPRLHSAPLFVSSLGQDAIDLAEHAGLVLDDWQRYVIEETSGRNAVGNYAAMEVGLIVPRQNGKGAIIEADQLKSLFLTKDEQIIYSAHQFKTAKAMYRRVKQLIKQTPDLHKLAGGKVDSAGEPIGGMYRNSNEETGIELVNGCRLNFFARSDGSGRGFSAPKMYFDEAYDLPSELISDMLPTLSAMRSPQVWYVSSAGKVSSEHLAKVRARGIKGDGRLAFYEWSAAEGSDLDDDDALYEGNPGLGIRVDYDWVRQVERGVDGSGLDDESYGRERLGIWPGTTTPAVIDARTWADRGDATATETVGDVAYAIDVSPDGSRASIGMAGWRPDGRRLVEWVETRESVDWAVDVASRITIAQRPIGFVVDGGSPAGALIGSLKAANVNVIEVGARVYANACGTFYNECMGRMSDAGDRVPLLVHLNQPTLNVALAAARKRKIGTEGAWAWSRANSTADITPVVACTLAIHGLSQPAPKRPSTLYTF